MRELTSTWRAFGSTAFDESITRLRGPFASASSRRAACEPLVLRLAGTPEPEVLAFARRCSARAVLEGVTTIYIELDGLTNLNFPVIGVLISILREAHERSAEVILRTGREDIRKALSVTALNKIFKLEMPPRTDANAAVAPRCLPLESLERPR